MQDKVHVSSEVGTLKRVIIHSPDRGLGRVVPSKAQDWLFEDIIHLASMRRHEYDFFVKILLYFLDPDKIRGKIKEIDDPANKRRFYIPDSKEYFNSDKVLDPQFLLANILEDEAIKIRLVTAVCAVERTSYQMPEVLLKLSAHDLAKTLISGALQEQDMIFSPLPNFIFTRDIGIVINDHILLNHPAKLVRTRESLIAKYIFFNHPYFKEFKDKMIEVEEVENQFFMTDEEKENHKVTLEGGDVMTVAPNHVLIGHSERTSVDAINQVIKALFAKNIVDKVSVIKIPKKRDYMHIDTIFTQVKRNIWVLFGPLSKKGEKQEVQHYVKGLKDYHVINELQIVQFQKGVAEPIQFAYLEDLLKDVSRNDLNCSEDVKFIYSGDNIFPFEVREQWTDSCNVLAIKEGVVIGYDRNTKTAEAFKNVGFQIIKAEDLLSKFENNELTPADVQDTLILLPSAELSRARGGSHCMSMPILRENIV